MAGWHRRRTNAAWHVLGSGGVADSHAHVLALLRHKFSNKTLFSGGGETQQITTQSLDREAIVASLLERVSAHRRTDTRPVLQSAVERFEAIAEPGQGTLATIDVPYFAVSCYAFPVRGDGARVAYLYHAQWMTGVC